MPTVLPGHHWANHAGCIHKRTKYNQQCQCGQIAPLRHPSERGSIGIVEQRACRHGRHQRNVIVRTRLHAVQAERAIEISGFLRLKQIQLAATCAVVAANAIVSAAGLANLAAPYTYFARRNQRADEVKLPDGAHILTEACAAKNSIDDQRRQKIRGNDPSCQPGTVP
jgi:hypothetical protein